MVTRAASQLIFVTPTVAPVTFAGPWTNATGLSELTLNANTKMIIAGMIYGAGGNLLKDGVGTLVITGTNATSGVTTTVTNGTLEVGVGGSLSGIISVQPSAGILKLDSTTSLSSTATLSFPSALAANSINLNYSGTLTINALSIDGSSQTSGTYGAIGSSATFQMAQFTGTGIINVLGAPLITQQPQPVSTYPNTTATFTVVAVGDPSFTYQWMLNGSPVSGATDSSYSFTAEPGNAGTYSVAVTNNFGHTNSTGAVLTVLATNSYVNTILASSPISYWRLDEGSGTIANDGVGGNIGLYNNVILGQPGYSLTDTDTCIALPKTTPRSFVQVTNFAPFAFVGSPTFTLEAWGYFTNFSSGVQRLFSCFGGSGGYAFGINGQFGMRFTTSGVQDADQAYTNGFTANTWYYLVCTCDGNAYHFYVNGVEVGTGIGVLSHGNTGTSVPLQFGANPAAYATDEQVYGRIDEVAIYGYNLDAPTILNHYNARYSTLAPPVVVAPTVNPPTNYVSLSSTLQENAAGILLNYQWYEGATLLGGQTNSTLILSPLELTNSGNYTVVVSNPAGTNTSPGSALVVLPIPTNSSQLNLTNGLVLHLPFDTDYKDISGHNNNGTSVGSTAFTNGAVGSGSLHYSSDTGSSSFNYVTLGVRPDLQFGSNVDFTVSYWIRQPAFSTYTNLPFFTDAKGSTGNGGYAFAPYAGSGGGGWIWTVGSVSSPNAATTFPDSNLINDGNWHHLVHSASRNGNLTTYLDGLQVDSQSIVVVGDIDTTNAATIGQDPTGAYPVTAQADIDDLGVWRRALSSLEVSGIYLAGASNSVSFAPPISIVVATSTTISNISGTTISYGGGSGSQFVLIGTTDIGQPQSSWTRIATNTSTPGTFTIPAVGSSAIHYYRVQSQ